LGERRKRGIQGKVLFFVFVFGKKGKERQEVGDMLSKQTEGGRRLIKKCGSTKGVAKGFVRGEPERKGGWEAEKQKKKRMKKKEKFHHSKRTGWGGDVWQEKQGTKTKTFREKKIGKVRKTKEKRGDRS